MNKYEFKKLKLPDQAGVYLFKKGKDILYVGKATSLKDRLASYFNSQVLMARGPRIVEMVKKAKKIDFISTDSVLEAVILESNLIKKHQPAYNARDKDNKSFYYVIATNEAFPKILMVRGRDLSGRIEPEDVKYSFGPFVSSAELKSALKIIRKIFPYRDKCSPYQKDGENKPCFNAQIGLCPGVCTGEINKKDYAKIVNNLRLFFEGKKKKLIANLEKEMKELAKKKHFEKAEVIKKKIFSLKHINDVALVVAKDKNYSQKTFRIEAYDVAHLAGSETVGVMVVLEDDSARKDLYRKFIIKKNKRQIGDTVSLKELLTRRLKHTEWPLPDLMVFDGGKAQLNTAIKILEKMSISVPVVSVVKNEKHKPKGIIGDKKYAKDKEDPILFSNSEAHRFAINFHRQRRGKII